MKLLEKCYHLFTICIRYIKNEILVNVIKNMTTEHHMYGTSYVNIISVINGCL